MKRYLLFLLSLMGLVLIGSAGANAETVSPYTQDFDGSFSVTSHDFKVGPGWAHIVDTYIDSYDDEAYISYSRPSTGVGGTQCLYTTDSQKGYGSYDLIVTPVVSGTVTLDVKYGVSYGGTSNYESYIKFFHITEAGGKLTRGEEIEADLSAVNTSDFTTVTIPVAAEGERIGIWMSYRVWIDNFTATSAEIELEKKLTLSRTDYTTWVYPDVDSDGNFTTNAYEVTVTNSGEADLTTAEEGYTVSLVVKDSTTPLATVAITEDLAVGAQTTVTIPATQLAYADVFGSNSSLRLDFREGVSGNTTSGDWYQPTAYAPAFQFRNSSGEVSSGASYAFGMITEAASVTYTIRNSGAAPLTVNSITVPEGFTSSVSAPLTVAAHADQELVVTLPATTPGDFSGNLVINYNDATGTAQDFTLALSGTVRDPNKWFADFEDEKAPSGAVLGENWSVGSVSINYVYRKLLQNSNSSTPTYFISPKLHATAGEAITFEAYGRSYGSLLNVKYSTDRENWVTLREMGTNDAGLGNQSWRTFTVNIPVEGDVYVGFEAGYVYIDNIYGLTPVAVSHDVLFSATLPTEATVNSDATITVKALNTLAQTETATLRYYVGETVASEQTVELKQATQQTISIVYTPYAAGTFETKAELELADGTKYTSATATLVVAEETAAGEVQVGNATTTSSNTPLFLNYMQSESETVYKAEKIGLPAGTAIKSIVYKGYKTTDEQTTTLRVWIANTTDEAPVSTGTTLADTEQMTKIYDGDYTFRKVGGSSTHEPLISITLAEPFIYDGTNLRVVLHSEAANYKAVSFEAESGTSGSSQRRQKDGDVSTASFTSDVLPVVYLGADKETSTFSGVLSIDNADGTNTKIAGATVALTSGNVRYQGTTDGEGAFSFNVVQDKKTYTLSFDYDAKNFFPLTEEETTVAFAGTSVVKNITLTEAVDLYIDSSDLPTTGKVGKEYVAKATVTNYNKTTMAAADYTATLFVDGEAVATAETVDLGEKEQHEFTFAYTPTTDGSKTAYIQFVAPTRTVKTAEATVAVEARHGLNVTATLPAEASVNHAVEVVANVRNQLAGVEDAGTYTVKYYVDGVAVAEAQPTQSLISSYGREFTMSYTPHAEGTFTTYVEVAFNDGEGSYRSAEGTLTVGAEVASQLKQVIPGNTNGRYAPVNPYYKGTQSEMIYTAEQLGIPAGTQISSIAFYSYGSFTFPIDIYVQNTEDTAPVSTGTTPVSTEGMTKVFSTSSYTISGGNSSVYAEDVFEFTTPFTYDGTNLRIYVDSKYADSYSMSTYFAQNNNYTGQAVLRYHDSAIDGASFSTSNLPAFSVGYTKAASTVSGVLSISRADGTSLAVSGATVTLTSGDVLYSGTTDTEGAYSIAVMQDTKTYELTLSGLPEDIATFPFQKTIQMAGESMVENITLTEAAGFYLDNLQAPATGSVNHVYTVSIDVTNYEATAQSGYTAQLVIGDEVVATAEAVELASLEKTTLSFSYTPHADGQITGHVQLVQGGKTYASADFQATIAVELALADVQVGTASGNGTSYSFVDWYYTDSNDTRFTDIIYSAAKLQAAGIQPGTAIGSISFQASNTPKSIKAKVTSWVGISTGDITPGQPDKSSMTEVALYDGTIDFPTNFVTVIDFSASPIVWDGTSDIRLYTEAVGQGSGQWMSASYEYDNNLVMYKNSTTATYGPVAIFSVNNAKHLTGLVTNENEEAVAGATVTLQNGEVIYTATTDSEGQYDVSVVQHELQYAATVTAEGYLPATATIAFSGADQVKNFVLAQPKAIEAGVYYLYNELSGKFASRGDAWGTRAVADDYGLPFNVTVADGKYSLQMLDNSNYYGDDYWMYADCTGGRVRTYTMEQVGASGYYLHNSSRDVADNRMYVYLKDDADKYAIAGNAILGDNISDEAQALWQFLTQAERDAIIAARTSAEKTAAYEAADIAEDANTQAGTATVLTFKTGSQWNFAAIRNGSNAVTNDNGTEVYQGTGRFTQQLANLESGLYKVSVQAFYRDGSNAAVADFTNQGYNLSVAYLEANGNKAQVKSWGIDRAADNNPNSMGEAAALFAEGKYLSETYVYVDEDGVLDLAVVAPSFIGAGWFIADNVTVTPLTVVASGIEAAETATERPEGIYNLQGQKVDRTRKGLYIIGGRKVVVK